MEARYDAFKDPKIQGDPYATLFVGRLAYTTSEATLERFFSSYGHIKHLRLVRDVVTQQSKGYAFVEFKSERSCLRAYQDAHRQELDGRVLLVDYERSRIAMDSQSFVGDFNLGLPGDNRYMNGLNLGGGMTGIGGTNDLMNPTGLDFSMMMMDSSIGASGSSTGMIDFPDELNSPRNSNNANPTGMSTGMAVSSAGFTASSVAPTSAVNVSSTEAIPFPASLANENVSSLSMNNTAARQGGVSTSVPNLSSNTTFGDVELGGNNFGGVNMNPMGGVNMNLNGAVNMPMNPGMNGFMPDMNMNMNMMNWANTMQPQQPNGMMMMNMESQTYFQSPQQQQQYMRMLQQQRYFASMQQAALQQQQRNMQAQNGGVGVGLQPQQMTPQMQMAGQQMAGQQMTMPNGQHTQGTAPNQLQVPTTAVSSATQRPTVTPGVATTATTTAGAAANATRQPWHSPADQALRKEMLNHIMRVLQSQRANAPANWLQRLPEMARRLEEECYRISASREEYANTSTLQTRLKNIVRSAQQRGRTPTSAGVSSGLSTAQQNTAPAPAQMTAPAPAPMAIPFPGADAVAPTASPPINAQPMQMPPELQDPSPAPPPMKPDVSQAIAMPLELQDPVQPPNMSMMGAPQQMMDATAQKNAAAAIAATNQNRSAQILRQFKARAQQVTSALEEKQTREYHNKLQSMTTSESMTVNSKGVLQRQQQRLLLLRHAMWCKAPDGTCAATPNCGEMKRLWQHMGNCQETTACSYPHCISSKYVLSHFQQCENPKCLVCQLLRYPVEVKEKNGALMMDADRALQQIQVATERRLQQSNGQNPAQAPQGMSHPPSVAQPMMPNQPSQPSVSGPIQFPGNMMTQQPLAMPQQQQPQPGTTLGGTPGTTSMMNGTMQNPVSTSTQPATAPSASPTRPTGFVPGLSEEENRQLAQIQARLRGVSLEQLNLNCKKLEGYAEQVRSQVNAIMNEIRQLLQMSNSTQDPNLKSQYDAQVQAKRTMLQDLNQRYKKCSSQHRIVKHVISARINAAPLTGIPPPANVPPPAPTPAPVPVQTSQPMNMRPLEMPSNLQGPTPTPPVANNQQVPVTSFTAQLQQANEDLRRSQQQLIGQTRAQSPDDILGEDMPASVGGAGMGGAMPLEMPSDLRGDAPAPAPVPAPVPMSSPTPAPSALAITAPSAGTAPQPPAKNEPTVNPLTMNNSKLNAMMQEYKKLGTPRVKAEPAVTVNTSEVAAIQPVPSPPVVTAAPTDVPTSMLNELSNDDLKKHIDSLVKHYNATMPPATLKKRLEGMLKGMMEHKFGWVFSSPVDPVALSIPNYFKIVRRPMDLGTIKKKLDAGIYKHMDQFAEDVRLTFNNAKTYNSEDQDVYNLAKDMLNDFNAEMRKLEAEVHEEEAAARAKESSCRLCGVERMVFEPAVIYCNGECNSRIRRNCYYFTAPDNKYHCCQQCFNVLGDSVRTSEGKTFRKAELAKKKNDEVHEEPWVQCDKCNRWVHQICALFNGKIDAEKKPQVVKSENNKVSAPGAPGSSHSISSTPGSEFLCPECLLDHRIKEPEKYVVGKHAFSAKDLMRTKLSDFLERRIYKTLQEEREDEARWTNKTVKDVPTAEHLTVRVVSNIEKQLMVRDKMYQRYRESHKYTTEHRFKSKCICMFQEIHGVSVLLFGMYVHEFDEQEANCNARRVYISYLDSVNYFEPAHLRTKIYHELLIAYMEFVRQRGFHTAHLWACPPLKGDDYILYCHPEAQKTPKSDRLRQWYVDMLTVAQKEGVVKHITNLYDEYWRQDNTACVLPYFEGDYWVGLAEEVIEKLEAEKPKKSKKGTNKRKSSTEMKKPSKKSKAKKTKRRKTSSAGTGTDAEMENATGSDGEGEADEGDDGNESVDEAMPSVETKERVITSLDDVDRTVTDPLMIKMGEVIEPMKDDFLVVKLQPYCQLCNTPVLNGTLWKDPTTSTELGLNPKIVQTCLCDGCYQKAKATPNAKVQEQLKVLQPEPVTWPEKCADPDEINDSEYFDTRQAFLSLCQGNHYQFDELRRAKHSSMMALYHLGNPNPNAYVYECNACTRDIVSGNRWHCNTCPDFDVCDACYAKEKHEHPLEKIPTSGVGAPGGKGGQGGAHGALTEQERREREQRAKNVRLHMQLLVHASACDGSCGSANCDKMKELMRHGAQCKQRALGGCTVCRRVWALLQLHARQCRQYECKVPRCHDLRQHVRKLQLQQQLMDDRRRAAVTQQYRQMQNGQSGQQEGGDDDPAGP
ncbi:hypothetical protein Poli38472_004112 [Pythium oligandrum]|uniref:histone acetyltransferase n=1 Tax=Pythium oligandrum TaxID=41045 RepID=A0A8K1FNY2_PYTOL|nr:hypothetical protein Poli38472_004112 [Pythium oligandrum]|eukprot:TMW66347.1 hypothetical protein Poli38472_004112 [Pythium oligandrum]